MFIIQQSSYFCHHLYVNPNYHLRRPYQINEYYFDERYNVNSLDYGFVLIVLVLNDIHKKYDVDIGLYENLLREIELFAKVCRLTPFTFFVDIIIRYV